MSLQKSSGKAEGMECFVPAYRSFAGTIEGAAKYEQEVEDYDAIL